MRTARKPPIRKNSRAATQAALACAAALLLIGELVFKMQSAVDADTVHRLILAKSFSWEPYRRSFFSPIKFEYLFSTPIVHLELFLRPLLPILLAITDAVGFHDPGRGTWLDVFFLACSVPGWGWALRPHFNRQGEALAGGALITLLMLLQARNLLLPEVQLGGVMPLGILLSSIAYGAYAHRRYRVAGVAAAALYYSTMTGELFALSLLLAHLGTRALSLWRPQRKETGKEGTSSFRQSCMELGLPFVLLVAPWWIAGWSLHGISFSPFLPELCRSFLKGAASHYQWIPASGDAGGPMAWEGMAYGLYQQYVRVRWYDWITPFVGDFFNELVQLSLFWAIAFFHALWRPRHRALALLSGMGVLVWISVSAGWVGEFDQRMFLILNAVVLAWLTVMSSDAHPGFAWTGRVALMLAVLTNLTPFMRTIHADPAGKWGPPMPNLLAIGPEDAANWARRWEGIRDPLVADGQTVLLLGYLSPQVPAITVPANFRVDGVMDRFLDHWKIRWTNQGSELKDVIREHRLEAVPRTDPNAPTELWEIKPLHQAGP